jgi:hypothetical protein
MSWREVVAGVGKKKLIKVVDRDVWGGYVVGRFTRTGGDTAGCEAKKISETRLTLRRAFDIVDGRS